MSNYRGNQHQRQDASVWPRRAETPDAYAVHLGRIADALEGILDALVGIQAQIPEQDHNHHTLMHEDRNHGV